MERLVIVDYSPILNRIFYSQKYNDTGTEKFELFSRALRSIAWMVYLVGDCDLVICIDGISSLYKKKILYPEYKASRGSRADIIEACNIAMLKYSQNKKYTAIRYDDYEADDIASSVINQNKHQYNSIEIFTTDKDYYQLLDTNVVVNRNNVIVNEYIFNQQYGFASKYFIDWLALCGDSADNIPGVPGIGPKTATALVKEFYDIKNIIYHAEQCDEVIMNKRIFTKINKNEDLLKMSYNLVSLDSTLVVPIKHETVTSQDILNDQELFNTQFLNNLNNTCDNFHNENKIDE